MEPHEKLEQSKIAKTKGTQFFKVSYIMNEKYLFDHPISNRILFSKFAKKNLFILMLFIVKQEGNYKVALKYYDKCQKNLEFETTLKGEDEENRKEIIVLAHINMAMCHLKLEHYVKVRDHCNKALDLDDKCVKAYFRRGQVRQKIGLPVIGNVNSYRQMD